MITIQPAVEKDARGIAHVHVSSWQTSYRGIVPDDFLDQQSLERREGYWRQVIGSEDYGHWVYCALSGQGEVVGFVSFGRSREESLSVDGEIYAIYLLEAFKRQGIGERLFRVATEKLCEAGFNSMMLWVLAENHPARKFYEKMGGQARSEQMITIGEKPLLEVAYGWKNLCEHPAT